MQAYIIENLVRFEPVECKLVQLESDEDVTIPFIASKVLEMLLQTPGQVVTRDNIFNVIFDKYHASCTNNNLNQYISQLRKHFTHLQIDGDIIKTVPKVGFIINLDVDINIINFSPQQVFEIKKEQIKPRSLSLVNFCTTRRIITWCIVWLFMLSGFLINRYDSLDPIYLIPQIPYEAGAGSNGKKCKVYHLAMDSSEANGKVPGYINNIAPIINDKCSEGNYVFYVTESSWDTNKYRLFILQCLNGLKETNCVSYYKSFERQ